MLNKISEKLHSWAKGRWVLVMFIADALMAGYVMPLAAGIMAFAYLYFVFWSADVLAVPERI